MKRFARYLLIAIVALIVGSALLFVWAMQTAIDVSTPAARAQYQEAMALGCKLRLPEALKTANVTVTLSPEDTMKLCGCAIDRLIESYAVAGKITPSDVSDVQIDEAELACLKEQIAQ